MLLIINALVMTVFICAVAPTMAWFIAMTIDGNFGLPDA